MDLIRVIFEKVGIIYLGMTVCAVSAAILFFPPSYLAQLMLTEVKEEYGKYIGPAFLLSAVYLAVAMAGRICRSIREWQYRRKEEKSILKKLDDFTPEDFSVLANFFDRQTGLVKESAMLDYSDNRVKLLEAYGIIIRISATGRVQLSRDLDAQLMFPYRLHPVAWKYVREVAADMRREENNG